MLLKYTNEGVFSCLEAVISIFDFRKIPDELFSQWQSFDWRESPFAPHLEIIQAKLYTGETVSGAGKDRAEAVSKAFAETAEAMALANAMDQRPSLREEPIFCSSIDGIAADASLQQASERAVFEAIERLAVWRWWAGKDQLARIEPNQKDLEVPLMELTKYRQNADALREVDYWQILSPFGAYVIIARSQSKQPSSTCVGYGCAGTLSDAITKATTELLLMELNYAEVLAASSLKVSHLVQRVKQQIDLLSSLDFKPETDTTASDSQYVDYCELAESLNIKVEDITSDDGPLLVVTARHDPKIHTEITAMLKDSPHVRRTPFF